MPLYEYRCEACDATVEVLEAPTVNETTEHRQFGSECEGAMYRIISVPRYNKRQGQSNRQRDEKGNVVTQHWDGRQDVRVKPRVVKTGTDIPELLPKET